MVSPPVQFPDGELQGSLPCVRIAGVVDDTAAVARFGYRVQGVGDVNGDGMSDVAMGAPLYDTGALTPDIGMTYVLFGADTLTPAPAASDIGNSLEGTRIAGAGRLEGTDTVFAGAGDVDGDGFGDILIGVPQGTPEGFSGEACLVYGASALPATVSLRDLQGSPEADGVRGVYFNNTLCAEPVPFDFSVNYRYNTANKHVYRQTPSSTTWPNCLAYATSHRIGNASVAGTLATIRSAAENTWLFQTFGPYRYIGLNDAAIEGTFVWVSGEPVVFTYWGGGEPNNYGSGEDYTQIRYDGRWNDLPTSYSQYGIVEFSGPGGLGYDDLDGDGVPDAFEDANVDGSPDGFPVSGPPTSCNGFNFGRMVASAGDINGDGVADMTIGRAGGSFVIFGVGSSTQATYQNRIRSGRTELGNIELGDSSLQLGDTVGGGVGVAPQGSSVRPASRVSIWFEDGGTGAQVNLPSTQTVTLFREPAPDLDVGEGTAEDDARWTPAGVHWLLLTNRLEFTASTIELHYLPEEVAGLDLQQVGVFYAKPGASLSDTTHWSWLPFEHDPDRMVFRVYREHDPDNAQEEFSGYYALIQADLVTYLGSPIPAVGITNDKVYEYGPEVIPEGMAFWHRLTRKLYAVHTGELTIKWKDGTGTEVSSVKAVNEWPVDESVYQPHVAGGPAVDLSQAGSHQFLNTELTCTEETVVADENQVYSNHTFSADLTASTNPNDANAADDPRVTGRSCILLTATERTRWRAICSSSWCEPTSGTIRTVWKAVRAVCRGTSVRKSTR